MAEEKCILDPYRDCLGLEKARQLEKIIDRHLSESDRTHQDLLKRLELLERDDARRTERDEHIMEKLDGLGDKLDEFNSRVSGLEELSHIGGEVKDLKKRVTDLEMKPARQWEKIVGGVLAAIAVAVAAFFLGKLGLPM